MPNHDEQTNGHTDDESPCGSLGREVEAFQEAAQRAGLEHEPLSPELLERVAQHETFDIARQTARLHDVSPDRVIELAHRQAWALHFADVAEQARRLTAPTN